MESTPGSSRAHRGARPPARPDRARRRGLLPRLRRRRLDLPLARPPRARLRVSASTSNHGLRGEESEADARFCVEVLGAEVVVAPPAATEAELRDLRYSSRAGRGLRATGHTASDQVETVLYRLVSSGTAKGIKARREDGVVRPLLPSGARRPRPTAAPRARVPARLVEPRHHARPHPLRDPAAARARPPGARAPTCSGSPRSARACPGRSRRVLVSLLEPRGLEGGRPRRRRPRRARVRHVWLEGAGDAGARGRLTSPLRGLEVRARRPGDRLAGRRKKVQDLLRGREGAPAQRDGMAARRARRRGRRPVPGHRARARRDAGRRRVRRPGQGAGARESSRARKGRGRGPDRRADAAGAHRRARRRDLRRLRRARPAAGRRPQGRSLLHGRPDARS